MFGSGSLCSGLWCREIRCLREAGGELQWAGNRAESPVWLQEPSDGGATRGDRSSAPVPGCWTLTHQEWWWGGGASGCLSEVLGTDRAVVAAGAR